MARGRLIKAIFQSPEARFIAVHVDAQLRYSRDGGAQGQQADRDSDAAGGGGRPGGRGPAAEQEDEDADARRKAVMARGGRERGGAKPKWGERRGRQERMAMERGEEDR